MLAAEFTPGAGFSIINQDSLPLQASEVRLRVDACGVCGSDRQVVKGESVPAGTTFPLIMGHEIAGTVIEVGEAVTDWQCGDQVVVHPFQSCGACAACRSGEPNLCIRQTCVGYHQPGGFAEAVAVSDHQLVKRSTACSGPAAALLVDAFATPYHALKQLGIEKGDNVLVIGTGGLGLATLRLARLFNVEKLGAMTRRTSGSDLAEKFDADFAITLEDPRSTARVVRRAFGAKGVDAVIDTVGTEMTASLAMDVVRPGGTVMVVGMSDDFVPIPMAKTVRRGLRFLTSYGSVMDDIRELMVFVDEGLLDPDELIAGTLPLRDIERAFSDERASGRWVVIPNKSACI
ncbi:zinc-binding dehydrogenase [Camelliibacillus cellulosilyticus]|uniref:Zinc-binding dehydrogenase n=1 Tax=Camelliibacillus cellulosilyticus TaxID=2174486 RepID=A0ABV9GMM8_9BACL